MEAAFTFNVVITVIVILRRGVSDGTSNELRIEAETTEFGQM